jgi:hypothetical protein
MASDPGHDAEERAEVPILRQALGDGPPPGAGRQATRSSNGPEELLPLLPGVSPTP